MLLSSLFSSRYIFWLNSLNFSLKSQNEPKWVAPLEIPIQLSGTFGELRNTHFHSGIDIKTQGKQGIKVFSIKDGRIKRIRVTKVGFGKTIYIEHNDGTTSVYGHLKKFSKEIELIVKKLNMRKNHMRLKYILKEIHICLNQEH